MTFPNMDSLMNSLPLATHTTICADLNASPGDGEEQESQACSGPWGHIEWDMP